MPRALNEDAILEYLTERLSPKRLAHSIGVRDVGVMLARRYTVNEEKIALACLLHDVGKGIDFPAMQALVKRHTPKGFPADAFESPALLHAWAGVVIARRDLGVTDKDVLSAIGRHTTGDKGLSLFDKIVYAADYLDPNRAIKGNDALLALTLKDFNEGLLSIISATISHIITNRRYLAKRSVDFYNETLARISYAKH